MTGFKEGASDDPFSSDDEADSDSDRRDDLDRDDVAGETSRATETATLPWLYRRSSITDGRTTRQFHLQDSTERRESAAKSDLERQLGQTVKKADLREAAYLAGLDRLDDVADQLREWGYDHE